MVKKDSIKFFLRFESIFLIQRCSLEKELNFEVNNSHGLYT